MRLRISGVIPAALLWLLACQGANVPDPSSGLTNPPINATLALTRFRSDSTAFALYSGVQTPGNLVIRDVAAWSALWQEIHGTVDPVPPLPDVDFNREMIVAAALGIRSSGGFNVLLTGASEDANGIAILVRETSPGADCLTTQALTQPIDLGRM